jgi:hypothetical protein
VHRRGQDPVHREPRAAVRGDGDRCVSHVLLRQTACGRSEGTPTHLRAACDLLTSAGMSCCPSPGRGAGGTGAFLVRGTPDRAYDGGRVARSRIEIESDCGRLKSGSRASEDPFAHAVSFLAAGEYMRSCGLPARGSDGDFTKAALLVMQFPQSRWREGSARHCL